MRALPDLWLAQTWHRAMFLSIFDIFKIGIGPSSSHTMGPMTAAAAFLGKLEKHDGPVCRLRASLHGSLALTGKGHASDRAVILGLAGFVPATLDADDAERELARIRQDHTLHHGVLGTVLFDPEADLIFDYEVVLPGHANGMRFWALDDNDDEILSEIYYSIGGGFVLSEAELTAQREAEANACPETPKAWDYPYPFVTTAGMLEMGRRHGKSIAEMKYANEIAHLDQATVDQKITDLIAAMDACIDRGLSERGILPGGLNVKRRAADLHEKLIEERSKNLRQPHEANEWMSVYALAVNEENAAGGRVVTSPTNGAAGVVPAVLRYYRDHCIGSGPHGERVFLLTASAIGALIKINASISGAEVGCQGEVGSAAAMAAAGLCAALGGSNAQIENAAEIALEHHLGMTCDPVAGLVQVPCIERNAMGAIKAVSASSLALRGDGSHFMPLDNCIETMRQTGLDMNNRYKETSLGGLAVNLPEC